MDGTGDAFRVGQVSKLFDGPAPSGLGYGYDVTADGERFLLLATKPPEALPPLTLVLNWTHGIGGE